MAEIKEEIDYVKDNYYIDCWGPDWERCSEEFYDYAPLDLGNWRDNSLAAALTRLPLLEENTREMVIKHKEVKTIIHPAAGTLTQLPTGDQQLWLAKDCNRAGQKCFISIYIRDIRHQETVLQTIVAENNHLSEIVWRNGCVRFSMLVRAPHDATELSSKHLLEHFDDFVGYDRRFGRRLEFYSATPSKMIYRIHFPDAVCANMAQAQTLATMFNLYLLENGCAIKRPTKTMRHSPETGRALQYETGQKDATGIDLTIYTNNRCLPLLQQTEPGSTIPFISYLGLAGKIPCLGDMLLQPIFAPSFFSASVLDDAALQRLYRPYMSESSEPRKDSCVKITGDGLRIVPNTTWHGTKITITRDKDLHAYLDAKTL
jgi:hypothetical protein